MKVFVRRDSATETPVDLGEGRDAEEKCAKLVEEHGASAVRTEDGSELPLPKPEVEDKAEVKTEVAKPVDFDDMTKDQLKEYLDGAKVEYRSDINLEDLVKLAKSTARKLAKASTKEND